MKFESRSEKLRIMDALDTVDAIAWSMPIDVYVLREQAEEGYRPTETQLQRLIHKTERLRSLLEGCRVGTSEQSAKTQ